MKQIELMATPRTVIGKQVKTLSHQGLVPGVMYGHGIEPLSLQFDAREVERVALQAGRSTLVQVKVEGVANPYLAIFRDMQRHPIKRNLRHIDLQALSLEEKVRLPIPVILTGDSSAVKNYGAMLMHTINEVEVECLPTHLISAIEVDVTKLTEPGQVIRLRDLNIPAEITLLRDLDDVVVQASLTEEETFEGGPSTGPAEVEVIRKKKEEEVA